MKDWWRWGFFPEHWMFRSFLSLSCLGCRGTSAFFKGSFSLAGSLYWKMVLVTQLRPWCAHSWWSSIDSPCFVQVETYMYIYIIYTYTRVHTYTCVLHMDIQYVHIYTCSHVHMCFINVKIYSICIFACVHIYTRRCVYIHTHTHACLYLWKLQALRLLLWSSDVFLYLTMHTHKVSHTHMLVSVNGQLLAESSLHLSSSACTETLVPLSLARSSHLVSESSTLWPQFLPKGLVSKYRHTMNQISIIWMGHSPVWKESGPRRKESQLELVRGKVWTAKSRAIIDEYPLCVCMCVPHLFSIH